MPLTVSPYSIHLRDSQKSTPGHLWRPPTAFKSRGLQRDLYRVAHSPLIFLIGKDGSGTMGGRHGQVWSFRVEDRGKRDASQETWNAAIGQGRKRRSG